jgi:hypothetical protein
MTASAPSRSPSEGLPSTFVPGRNLVFLPMRPRWPTGGASSVLVGGMCETDFSGYPDCRRATIDAMETALNLGMEQDFRIETPLMALTKAETWALAKGAGRRGAGGDHRRGQPHLLPGRARDAARLGLRLRDLPGLRAARQGWAEAVAVGSGARGMSYAVKEIFLTLQGEGGQAGGRRCSAASPAATCGAGARRTGPRRSARFCDTDFVGMDGPGGGRFADADAWPRRWRPPGAAAPTTADGADRRRAAAAGRRRTSSPRCTPAASRSRWRPTAPCRRRPAIDWICVSPKADAPVVQTRGQELKLVYPQAGVDPARFEASTFETLPLQPMDGPDRAANTQAAIAYCLDHPRWRLSVQTHKYLGIA